MTRDENCLGTRESFGQVEIINWESFYVFHANFFHICTNYGVNMIYSIMINLGVIFYGKGFY